jgi:hypothetical protein
MEHGCICAALTVASEVGRRIQIIAETKMKRSKEAESEAMGDISGLFEADPVRDVESKCAMRHRFSGVHLLLGLWYSGR